MKKQRKFLFPVLFVLCIGVMLPIVFFSFLFIQDTLQTQRLNMDLSNAIRRHIKEETPSVDISTITTFSWDRLYIFGPYTSQKTINNALGFAWQNAHMELNDTDALFVFTQNSQVVRYTYFPRVPFDFGGLYRKAWYSRHEARFIAILVEYVSEEEYRMEWVHGK